MHRDRRPAEGYRLRGEDPLVEGATGREGVHIGLGEVRVRLFDRLEEGGEVVGRDVGVHHDDRSGHAAGTQALHRDRHRFELVAAARGTEVGDDARTVGHVETRDVDERTLEQRQPVAPGRVLRERMLAVAATGFHLPRRAWVSQTVVGTLRPNRSAALPPMSRSIVAASTFSASSIARASAGVDASWFG